MALDVALGIQFLHSKNIIHRDVAARNVLVGEFTGDKYVVKISDYGLARQTRQSEVYCMRSSVFPVKWTAIESIKTRQFTSQSDIWSYGVLLYEIFSWGGTPYLHMENGEIEEFLRAGNRLEKPQDCPSEIYNRVMIPCFEANPAQRLPLSIAIAVLQQTVSKSETQRPASSPSPTPQSPKQLRASAYSSRSACSTYEDNSSSLSMSSTFEDSKSTAPPPAHPPPPSPAIATPISEPPKTSHSLLSLSQLQASTHRTPSPTPEKEVIQDKASAEKDEKAESALKKGKNKKKKGHHEKESVPECLTFKVVLVGQAGGGKSSLLLRLATGEFHADLGNLPQQLDTTSVPLEVDGVKTNLLIWDACGQERFRNITSSHYRGALGALVVFNMQNPWESEVRYWMGEIRRYCMDDIAIVIVASKCDLYNDHQIFHENATQFCNGYCAQFIETSALTGENVTEAFTLLTRAMLKAFPNGRLSCVGGFSLASTNEKEKAEREKRRRLC
eukprot:TRINITY_DN4234_c0_g1_i1.p1 TRINITY_DN4234_c0_g1~~TRINITY_DN4234_c0_g1_i1.p1  ORF type:complete len:501 (+),score=83.07 TRINITY_DN4234_c0_g1_i1:606-2108(+)